MYIVNFIREAAKKVLLLMTGPFKPNPRPPLEFGRFNFGTFKKKVLKKDFFPLIARPFTPPPRNGPARPLKKELFCGFPMHL